MRLLFFLLLFFISSAGERRKSTTNTAGSNASVCFQSFYFHPIQMSFILPECIIFCIHNECQYMNIYISLTWLDFSSTNQYQSSLFLHYLRNFHDIFWFLFNPHGTFFCGNKYDWYYEKYRSNSYIYKYISEYFLLINNKCRFAASI